MNINNFTRLENNMLDLLSLRAGEKFSQREIAKMLNVSPTAVAKSLPALLEKKLVIIEKTSIVHYVSFNQQNKQAIHYKRVSNLKRLYESGFVDFVTQSHAGATIVLFGSFARGEDSKTSDIDIAIIGRDRKNIDLSHFENMFFRKININFYKSLKEIHIHLRNNICNGIVLGGSIEL